MAWIRQGNGEAAFRAHYQLTGNSVKHVTAQLLKIDGALNRMEEDEAAELFEQANDGEIMANQRGGSDGSDSYRSDSEGESLNKRNGFIRVLNSNTVIKRAIQLIRAI